MVVPLLANTNFESEVWLKIKCTELQCEIHIAVVMADNDSTVFNKNMMMMMIIIIVIIIMMRMMTMVIIDIIKNNNKLSDFYRTSPLFSGSLMFKHIFCKFGDNWLSWLRDMT